MPVPHVIGCTIGPARPPDAKVPMTALDVAAVPTEAASHTIPLPVPATQTLTERMIPGLALSVTGVETFVDGIFSPLSSRNCDYGNCRGDGAPRQP